MSSLNNLVDTAPSWVTVLKKTNISMLCSAFAVKPSSQLGRLYQLEVRLTLGNFIQILEVNENSILPRCCIERHINSDATFCLHWNSSKPLLNTIDAQRWWLSLGQYLNNQDYASKTRRWPMNAQLSHGDAASIQITMENIAEELGWKDELLSSMFRNQGWLADRLPTLTKDKKSVVNARSTCPRGCLRLHGSIRNKSCEQYQCNDSCAKNHDRILRIDCPHRSSVEALVVLEYNRRKVELDVITNLRNEGINCCGTMENCPLNQNDKVGVSPQL